MRIFHDLKEWNIFRKTLASDLSLGFVPTMGNLHAGHASLFTTCAQENHYTVASLFVNPTQFNQAEDYKNYPRTLTEDIRLMTDCGVNFCLIPEEKDLYADRYAYQIQEKYLCNKMEGKYRPGHFTGVLTIVMKLLNLVKPHNAYFGEKDFQQYLLIKGLVNAFFMDIAIKSCPTIREISGLACSSRNNRLNQKQKKLAEQFATLFLQKENSCEQIKNLLTQKGIFVEYIEEYEGRRFAAIQIGSVRLIDNYLI